MRVLTRKEHISTVADRWLQQYRPGSTWIRSHYFTAKQMEEAWEKLKGETDEEKIAEIIGNPGWTSLTCNECHVEVQAVAVYGEEEDDWELRLCSTCLGGDRTLVEEAIYS